MKGRASFKILIFISIVLTITFTENRVFPGNTDSVSLPDIKRSTLKNGIETFYIKDELPHLLIIVSIGYGKLYENSANAGISELLADTINLGGSEKYTGQDLHYTVESIGGIFSVTSSWEQTYITMRVLERYAETAFDIVYDVIQNPLLDNDSIGKARSLLLEDVRRKKDEPDILAFEKLRELIFNGDGYGAVPTESTLKSITRKDLINIKEKYYTGKNTIMGISTSLSPADVNGYLQQKFQEIKEGEARDYYYDEKEIARQIKEKSKKIYIIPKDIPQSTIVLGTTAPSIRDSAVFPLTVMNYILGGSSFTSRLMREIRVKRGLSYAVQSIMRFRKNTGVFIAYAQTRHETTDRALSLLSENINLMREQRVTDEELRWTKESIKNSYIFEFDTPQIILNKYTDLYYNNLPETFYKYYLEKIEGVTTQSIIKHTKDLLENGLIKVVVGKRELKDSLSNFGEIVIIEE